MSASSSHARYEELVVGHALSALEPEDEQALLRHLPTCAACERDLAVHQETLAHLAHVADGGELPPGLWAGIRGQVEAESGPGAFPELEPAAAPVIDLRSARSLRRLSPQTRKVGAWASVAAAVAVVAAVGVGVTGMARERTQQGVSDRLAAAVHSVESAPGQTVPLAGKGGAAVAIAVVQSGRVSLIVDGISRNDTSSSIYVLWAQSGSDQARALATFDVHGPLDVLRDVATINPGAQVPQLFVITKERGRTAPVVAQGAALATGRAA